MYVYVIVFDMLFALAGSNMLFDTPGPAKIPPEGIADNGTATSYEQNGPIGLMTGNTFKTCKSIATGKLLQPTMLYAVTCTAPSMNPLPIPFQSTLIELLFCPEVILPTALQLNVYPS